RNTGDWNTGYRNTGDWNTGDRNTGDWNTGDRNTGDWNTGDWNTGFFNTITPDDVLIFNKPCSRQEWDNADKPNFLYFSVTEWIYESEMTDEEKVKYPTFFTTGGYLKKYNYKEAFQKAYNSASKTEQDKLKMLPNFDADVFFEISGIKVN
ncbi:pentapeptide repeat-containing protein, partial [Dyadobacter sp. CY323]|uniref:pentapeptide repeat-containing protein n=1 Tax=Dyadobacter sp. CY323 TaxID=2907302 RepID=UPI001F2EF6B7